MHACRSFLTALYFCALLPSLSPSPSPALSQVSGLSGKKNSKRKQSRLEQLVMWCGGESFQGLLVFDECHRAKNYKVRRRRTLRRDSTHCSWPAPDPAEGAGCHHDPLT